MDHEGLKIENEPLSLKVTKLGSKITRIKLVVPEDVFSFPLKSSFVCVCFGWVDLQFS